MEVLEVLFASAEVCGCFLELFALVVDGTAAYSGLQTRRRWRAYKKKRARGEPVPPKPPSVRPAFLLGLAALAMTALVVFLRLWRR